MAGVTGAAAYQRLEKTDNEISKGLQFWGGITAQQIEADKARAARKAEADADRKEREGERLQKDLNSKRFDFTSKDAGYNTLTENYSAFSRDAEKDYSGTLLEYEKAKRNGNWEKAHLLEDDMQRIQTAFKEHQGAASKFNTLYSQFQEMENDGKLSDYDKGQWKILQGYMKGDSKNVFLKYDKDNKAGKWMSREVDADGNEMFHELSVADIDNGRVTPLLKQQINGKGGLIENYVNQMGTYEKDWYTQGKDRSTKGYNEYAEKTLKSTINSDLDDGEIKDLAAQMFNITSGLTTPEKVAQARVKVVEELSNRVMRAEDVKDSTKLNLDEAELALARQKEARIAAEDKKPKAGSEEEKLGIRKQNINDAINKNNVNDFKSGDFKWAGKEYTATNAVVLGDKVVVYAKNDKGKSVKIPVSKTEAGLNELYNAFEKSNWTMDKVQLVTPVQWRNVSEGTVSNITDLLGDKFEEGRFKSTWLSRDDENFKNAVKEFYPEAVIENSYFGSGDIIVNGQPIYLEGKSKQDIDTQLQNALGTRLVNNNNDPEGLFTN